MKMIEFEKARKAVLDLLVDKVSTIRAVLIVKTLEDLSVDAVPVLKGQCERLTFEGNFCDIALCTSVPGGSFCDDGCCSQRKVWERLKAYEDTGLTPEICAEYRKFEDEVVGSGLTFGQIVELMTEKRREAGAEQ